MATRTTIAAIVAIGLATAANAYPTYTFSETIALPGTDILNIGTDGVDLLVLHNSSIDRVRKYSTSGTLLQDFSADSAFTTGITWDGASYVFARGTSSADKRLYRMDSAGAITGPFGPIFYPTPTTLSFDGTSILFSYYAQDSTGPPLGDLTARIDKIDPASYAVIDSIYLTAETGTDISDTPVYGAVWHDGDYFVSYQGVNKVYRFDPTGIVVQEIPICTDWPRGIAFIGDNLFVAFRGAEIYRYVPEPATLSLLAAGLGALWLKRRRKAE